MITCHPRTAAGPQAHISNLPNGVVEQKCLSYYCFRIFSQLHVRSYHPFLLTNIDFEPLKGEKKKKKKKKAEETGRDAPH